MPVTGSFALMVEEEIRRRPEFYLQEANDLSERTTRAVKRRTPVGKRIDPHSGEVTGESGELRESVNPIRARRIAEDRYEGGAETDVKYANAVEYGTRRHIIRPRHREWLRFWEGGRQVFAKKVEHPGFEGRHMFSRGLDDVRREWDSGAGQAHLRTFLDGIYH